MNLVNHFLIAMPSLADPNFRRTVTFVCAHGEDGAMGIVINRPLDIDLGEVFDQMSITGGSDEVRARPVLQGGPVQRERGFVLHEPLGAWESVLPVTPEVGVATSRDILAAIAAGEGPRSALVALGYAGWGAGQLEREMVENAWLSGPADRELIFEVPFEARWESAVRRLGIDLDKLSAQAGHA
ncbi:MAG: YqgE/AlgH family protein [Ectothiorhodospiraceae bacterium]|nr:YqgE/AlgH family protein [Chromatiales bacterium]MCP5157311.1 YqgE/AlgH family protein [Ectothiorhodospiraceae bacterium]